MSKKKKIPLAPEKLKMNVDDLSNIQFDYLRVKEHNW
jgi:hypothetical protein